MRRYCIYLLLNNLGYFLGGFGALMGILSPFFGGIVIAYILDPMVRFFHAKLLKYFQALAVGGHLLAYCTGGAVDRCCWPGCHSADRKTAL